MDTTHDPRYPRPHERFHLPFPSTEHYEHPDLQISRVSGELEQKDLLLRLPNELSALVLSFLPPAALDAARCTSRAWRYKIMSDNWILSAVLEPHSAAVRRWLRPEDPQTLNKRLIRKLDGLSALPTAFLPTLRSFGAMAPSTNMVRDLMESHLDSSNTWRTRFRERSIEFRIASRCSHVHLGSPIYSSVVTSVALSDTAEFVIFMMTDTDTTEEYPMPCRTSTLVVYRLGLTPLYIGATQYSRVKGSLNFEKLQCQATECQMPQSWILRFSNGGNITSYRAKSLVSFQNGDEEYELSQLRSGRGENGHDQPSSKIRPFALTNVLRDDDHRSEINSVTHKPHPVSGPWKLLAHLPIESAPSARIHWHSSRETFRYVIAKYVKTGDVFVLRLGFREDEELERPQEALALLAPPRQGLVFKNLAVSPWLGHDHRALIAIIWQEPKSNCSRPELFTYAFESRDPVRVCRSGNACYYLMRGSAAFPDQAESSQPCIAIEGKRIVSLDQRMGGLHPLSPLREITRTNLSIRDCDQEDALGGLQMICRPFTREESRIRTHEEVRLEAAGIQRVLVIGPHEASPHIKLRIFDLSFGDTLRLSNVLRVVQNRDGLGRPYNYRNRHCACPLHDESFRVTFPDTWCKTACNEDLIRRPHEPKTNAFWPKMRKSKSPPTTIKPASGSIEPSDSPARQAALEREQEFLKDMIRWMKECGLPDDTIETEWSGALWTQRGQLKKPEGWRDLRSPERDDPVDEEQASGTVLM